jgi:hypothetical protein
VRQDSEGQKKRSGMIRLQVLLLGATLVGAIYFGVIANGSLTPGSAPPEDLTAAESLATRTPFEEVATLTPTETPTPEPTPTPEGPPVSLLEEFEQLFPGIYYKREANTTPRTFIAHIVVVDLSKRNINLMVTPEEGLGTTTSRFLLNYDLQLAINGDGFFEKEDPIGLAAYKGKVYSEASGGPTIFILKNGEVKIGGNPPEKKIWYAISGSHILVRRGRVNESINTCVQQMVYCVDLAPRTSVGISAGNYMIIILVEGPASEPRDALTLQELAKLHIELGSVEAIAMDGGGSTTLVVDTGNGVEILNNPSDGSEREVANHLGIYFGGRGNSDGE